MFRDKVGKPITISIHALLAESDAQARSFRMSRVQISIHALLAESDVTWKEGANTLIVFQSTLSLRRATVASHGHRPIRHISIHALLAESDPPPMQRAQPQGQFQSTLSLRRATFVNTRGAIRMMIFQSTLSLRRATSRVGTLPPSGLISIHALLAESDICWL